MTLSGKNCALCSNNGGTLDCAGASSLFPGGASTSNECPDDFSSNDKDNFFFTIYHDSDFVKTTDCKKIKNMDGTVLV